MTGKSPPRKASGNPRILQHLLGAPDQHRKVLGHNLPDDVQIHSVIAMYQTVSQADHLAPWNIGTESPGLRRDSGSGLAHDLEQADNSESTNAVFLQILT